MNWKGSTGSVNLLSGTVTTPTTGGNSLDINSIFYFHNEHYELEGQYGKFQSIEWYGDNTDHRWKYKIMHKSVLCFALLLLSGYVIAQKGHAPRSANRHIEIKFPETVDSVLYNYISYIDTVKGDQLSSVYKNPKNYFFLISKRSEKTGDGCHIKDYVLVMLFAIDHKDAIRNNRLHCTDSNSLGPILKHTGRYAILKNHYKIPVTYDFDWVYCACGDTRQHSFEDSLFKHFKGLTLKYYIDNPNQLSAAWEFRNDGKKKILVPQLTPY